MSNESMDMNLSKLKFSEIVKDREVWHAAVHGGFKDSDTTEQLNNNNNILVGLRTGILPRRSSSQVVGLIF